MKSLFTLVFSTFGRMPLITALVASAPAAMAETNFITGEVIEFTSPDDLLLDPAIAIIAVDVFGDADSVVNGVTFLTDSQTGGSGTATNGGVSVTTTATNSINDWATAPAFTGGTGDSAANLANVMRDIRWEGSPNPITSTISGLVPGDGYNIQILTNEGADRNRRWDIEVNGELAVDDYSSEGGTGVWTANNSFAYSGNFAAASDGTIVIRMAQNLGGEPQIPGTDNNPILQGIVVHALTGDPFGDADLDGITNAAEDANGLDKNDPSDAAADNDGDGLSNFRELVRLGTNPNAADSDGDGLSDGNEIALGIDPNNADTDGDGLSDGAETADLGNGLVAYWPLDGDTNDVIGGYNGDAMGTAPLTFDAGKLGSGGVDLDGVDQFIQISGDENVFDFGAPDAATGFTISAWFRVDAFTKSWQALIAKGEGNRWRVHRRGADAPAVFAANGGNADVPAYDGTLYPIDDGNYHHVAVVSVPGDRVELWLDGDLVSTGPAPILENGANPMMIGENPDALGRTWDGGVDDVGAWNRPLNSAEIGAIWNGGAGNSIGDLMGPSSYAGQADSDGD